MGVGLLNFNDFDELPNRYLGSDKKKTIKIDGKKHLLKFPDPTREKNRSIPYINNALSEYIGCKIYTSLGIPTQEVVLGYFTEENNKIKLSCACRDFCEGGFELYEAEALMLSKTDIANEHRTELSSIISLIENDKIMSPLKDELKEHFYDMFIVDYLICNPDRHNGNWGVLNNPNTGETKVAPVYDCGSCLMPVCGDEELSDSFAKSCAINCHSAVLEDGKRIMSSQYIKAHINTDLDEAIKRIVPKIDIEKINAIIDSIDEISDVRKDFYKSIVNYNYSLVLLPALKDFTKIRDIRLPFPKDLLKQTEDKFNNGNFFNTITLPKGTILNGNDISGFTIHPKEIKESRKDNNIVYAIYHIKGIEPLCINLQNNGIVVDKINVEDLKVSIDNQREKEIELQKEKSAEREKSKEKNIQKDVDTGEDI